MGLHPAISTDKRSRSCAANSSWNSPNSLAVVSTNGLPVSAHKMIDTLRGATFAPRLSTTCPTIVMVRACGQAFENQIHHGSFGIEHGCWMPRPRSHSGRNWLVKAVKHKTGYHPGNFPWARL